jgi:hypothetical protein
MRFKPAMPVRCAIESARVDRSARCAIGYAKLDWEVNPIA